MDIKIEKYWDGMEYSIYELIKRVYDEFVAIDYSDEGNKVFYEWIEPARIAERQKTGVIIFVAMIDTKMTGMIEVRDNNHVSLLFVDKEYQGHGIARQLFLESIRECLKRNPGVDKITVFASPYSVPIYRKLGFVETDRMQEKFGILYIPMEMEVKQLQISNYDLREPK